MVQSVDYAHSFKHLTFQPAVVFKDAETLATTDNDGVACNGKLIAAQWGSNATIAVFNAEKP